MKSWPSVCIFSSGVRPAVSPKSYRYSPRVRLGQAAGSTATMRVFLPVAILSRTNGSASPAKLRAAADAADDHVGVLAGQLELLAGSRAR